MGGKASSKGEATINKKSRTIYFGKFPEETKADVITAHITEWMAKVADKVEEVYAFGKFAERGAARFTTEADMWEFLMENRGKLQYEALGTKVYVNPDPMHDPNPDKTKAVRKVVRLLIETNGGDSTAVKKNIATDYTKGKVWWKDSKVAEWDETIGRMTLIGPAAECQAAYDKLMGRE